MAEVVENSLRYLPSDDIRAMISYLRSAKPQPDAPPQVKPALAVPHSGDAGERLFVQSCAGCHLPNGEGRQSAWAALRGSHTVADAAGTNLLQVLLHGSEIRTSEGAMFMPGFAPGYTDTELAALANYTAGQFGLRSVDVTPAEVAKRRDPPPPS